MTIKVPQKKRAMQAMLAVIEAMVLAVQEGATVAATEVEEGAEVVEEVLFLQLNARVETMLGRKKIKPGSAITIENPSL
jgi:hypothetical protein